MGYDDLYWFPGHYDSSFGTEAQLRSLITTFKAKGVGTIADVVINHRKNVSSWVDFPKETYNGVTYELKSTDICSNDDGGKTKTWATQNGYSLSSNNDTGEGWDGMRDLDHKSENVQTNVKAYLKMLLEDLGYVGFRYDMVKGYAGSYTQLYNEDSKPQFSVGEYWDGNATAVKNWINAASKTSAAFDFPFRYTVRDAINNNDWRKLSGNSLISDNNYKQYSVTFVENHDTEKRSNADQDPIRKDTLAANAFLLAMPGTPCVFLTHWIDCKRDIKAMIDVRNAVGIHNQSEYLPYATQQTYYAVGSTGSKGEMLAVVGFGLANYTPNARFVKVLSGYHYAYYMNKSMETAWVDLPSGEYDGKQQAMLTAVSTNGDAQLVYTTDGSELTAQSTKVASGTKIDIEGDVTLKVGLLIGSTVSGIVTRVYTTPEPMPIAECIVNEGEICAFFEAPSDWHNDISCWAWTDTPSDNFTFATGGWPGVTCTLLGVAENGNKVWKWSWDGTKQNNSSATQPAKIIFNNTSSPQTADLPFTNGGYYNMNGLVKVITGIEEVIANGQKLKANSQYYDLTGRRLNGQPTKKGLYIVNGRKIIR
jgi:alpha-amylase